jgi:uncharacterized iron-regulated membrane protein
MRFRKTVTTLHRWLGFAAGLVVIVSFLPAAVFVWEEELRNVFYRNFLYVEPAENAVTLPVSQLLEKAQQALPGMDIGGVEVRAADRAYVFTAWKEADQPGRTWFSEMDYWLEVCVDPYRGEVLGVINKQSDWITITRYLHQQLLLSYDTGHLIVAGATLIMFIMGISGIILWFPKNKAAIRQRFTIRWNARWRRVNYDLHNVGGFYAYALIVLLAATGLVWSFTWWTNGIYRLLGDDPRTVFARPEPPAPETTAHTNGVDIAFRDALSRVENWTEVHLEFPGGYGGDTTEMSAFIRYRSGTSGWDESDMYYYQAATGEAFFARTQADKSLGEKWRNSNYAIHVGNIYGLPTKLLACFAALFGASLPVTGFLIWRGKQKKARKPGVRKPESRYATARISPD